MKSAIPVNTFQLMLKKYIFNTLYYITILLYYIYIYHTQSNCLPVLHVGYYLLMVPFHSLIV